MMDTRIREGLATFAAGYLKRWLEGNLYDKLFKTEFGGKLKNLDKKSRYGIELCLNLLTVFFDQKLAEDTTLKKLVKEVGLDIGPEISKRLVNNANTPLDKELVSVLLEIDDQTRIDLLNWLYTIEDGERKNICDQLSGLPLDEIVNLAKLTRTNRENLHHLFRSPETRKLKNDITLQLKAMNDKWENWLEEKRKTKT